jgi:hypothetical protein
VRIVKRLLLLYIIFKPFYIFSSGAIQISDIFLLAAFILVMFLCKFDFVLKKKVLTLLAKNKSIIIFIVLATTINSLHFLYYKNFKFILSSMYFIFILIAIILFSLVIDNKKFILKMKSAFKFGLILQLVIYIFGLGRYYDINRYMGTFNDPNQFGYFILISFIFMYAINVVTKNTRIDKLYLLITTFLVFKSASTGMLLGLFIFLFTYLLSKIITTKLRYEYVRNFVYYFSLSILILTIGLLIIKLDNNYNGESKVKTKQYAFISDRLNQKLTKANGKSEATLWQERGYDKMFLYPKKIIYGAGEGMYERFSRAAFINEFHTTFPSLLFYYGLFPFFFIIKWFYENIRNANRWLWVSYLALFIESFTLLNQRQALFWIIVTFGSVYVRQNITIGKEHA